MNYNVAFTDTAVQDLREIAIWIAEQSKNVDIAKAFVNELMAECRKLEIFPERGAFPRDGLLRRTDHRYIVHKEYFIFYLIDEENKTVNIMAVFNSKKDYMRVLK